MGQLSKYLRHGEGTLTFFCPGCKEAHTISVRKEPHPCWTWNGDADKPVFTPSVLVTGVKGLTDEQHAAYMRGEPLPAPTPMRCHTFVGCNGAQPGEIIFLSDCTHELAGKTVPLAELPKWMQDEP